MLAITDVCNGVFSVAEFAIVKLRPVGAPSPVNCFPEQRDAPDVAVPVTVGQIINARRRHTCTAARKYMPPCFQQERLAAGRLLPAASR